ncbi:iron ABC transporter permease [Ancylomarina euxinus]|uniref:Iron ABC transporter permease n=1 Tax=Ancylomarina euxinus TaxID=2283627 RepID=A0A425XXF3_9BACT|nr:iron ABC transporter permease [Ancylomarina euxinus]MCZ4696091.1 iron ABC transporter permease [Ancylomarina euxinus]MUP16500.1 iron chelate uptake ABC transporter family permease subunit [Ancylomarina euxinus]RRG19349.1 iron ABC transporter permease [Ancylomarina euxinus]
MQNKTKIILFVGLFILIALFLIVDLVLGSVSIPSEKIMSILMGEDVKTSWNYIILNFRLPKAITAILVGAGLSVSGLMMQTLFRNPLAGPYVLGISSGASLGVALMVMASVLLPGVFGVIYSFLGSWALVVSAIAGASIIFVIIGMASIRISDSVSLLIIGIMFGSITGAVVNILQYFSDPEQLQSFIVWTFGSLSGVTWNEMNLMAPVVVIGLLMSFVLIKPLDALLLGENYARGVGISVNRTRIWVIISTALVAGTLTAFTGPIAFIGVAVPHMARAIFGTASHKVLLPAVVLIGAALMLICDILSQVPGNQTTLPINSVTAIFGGPVVIWVIIRSRSVKASFS